MFQEVSQDNQQELGQICIKNNDEQKQPEAKIHMIKKKNMKLQWVVRSKLTNENEKDVCVKVLTGKNDNDSVIMVGQQLVLNTRLQGILSNTKKTSRSKLRMM